MGDGITPSFFLPEKHPGGNRLLFYSRTGIVYTEDFMNHRFKINDRDGMQAGRQRNLTAFFRNRMSSVMIDNQLIPDVKSAAVIRHQIKRIDPLDRNVDQAGKFQAEVIDPPNRTEIKMINASGLQRCAVQKIRDKIPFPFEITVM